jgi:hypothetical protein
VAHPFVEYEIEPVLDHPTLGDLRLPTASPSSTTTAGPDCPPFQVPTFSHGPPPSIRGSHRWLTAPKQQAISRTHSPVLHDVYVWVVPFLDPPSQRNFRGTSSAFRYGSIGTPLWYTRPLTPYRRRLWGFGTPTASRSTRHNTPSVVGVLPYI